MEKNVTYWTEKKGVPNPEFAHNYFFQTYTFFTSKKFQDPKEHVGIFFLSDSGLSTVVANTLYRGKNENLCVWVCP